MTFAEFERHARTALEEIPPEYLAGIDGLTVSREAPAHPDFDGVWTLGECLTEEHVSDYASADTLRSSIVLYWGSFHQLASRDSDFDWEGEIWETLTHELRHHLESLAGDDALEEVDRAAEESFRRAEGEPFDARYYQFGTQRGPGWYSVEKAHFIERQMTLEVFEAMDAIDFDFRGARYSIPCPSELGDVHFVWVENLGEGGESLEVVLVRKRGWLRAARRLLSAAEALVLESSARAEPTGAAG
jgi:hypothetical protein